MSIAGDRDLLESRPIAVVGTGAVGGYFGGMLARAGARITFIGRPRQVEAMTRNGLVIESARFRDRIPVSASAKISDVREAALVLLCVKTPDTETAARSLAPHLADGALVVSLQNGVDNVDRIRAVADIDAVPAAVYVSAELTAPGTVRHTGRGDLVIGDLPPRRQDAARRHRLEGIVSLFEQAGVPCRLSANIEAELWVKLIMNSAYNAISALCCSRYGRIAEKQGTRAIVEMVIQEALAVARAAGVRMPDIDLVESAWKLAESISEALSSTAQDIARGKRTEIDSLNGYVARRGAELGIPTPVNQTLYALVGLLEEGTA